MIILSIPKKSNRVLLVENDPASLLIATTLLEMYGYEFDVVQDGEEAFEKIQNSSYNIILMNMRMPGSNAIETTHRIRDYEKSNNKSSIQILCMIAMALRTEENSWIQSGINDCIVKPLNPDEFQYKLEKLNLDREKETLSLSKDNIER